MMENRLRVKEALTAALAWRVDMGGVVNLMLDYAGRKPISFPTIVDAEAGLLSDARSASLTAGPATSSFRLKCALPLDACVSRWSIVMAPIDGNHVHRDVCIGVVAPETRQSFEGDWFELCCKSSMYVKSQNPAVNMANLQYKLPPRADGGTMVVRWLPSVTIPRVVNAIPRVVNAISAGTDSLATASVDLGADSLPSATVRVSVDMDAEIVTWTLSNDKPLTLHVPGLRKKHAYVDLSPYSRATIIQHPDPWLF
jgi:hypothetical protein